MVKRWPRASDFVIVPSISEMTICVVCSQKKILEMQIAFCREKEELTLNEIVLTPFLRLSFFWGNMAEELQCVKNV